MKSLTNNLEIAVNNSNNEVKTLANEMPAQAQTPATFTAAQLWNIQKQRKSRYSYSTRIAC